MPPTDASGRSSALLALKVTMGGLDAAYVTVTQLPSGAIDVKIGSVDMSVTLLDHPAAVRRTVDDIVAQLDAIEGTS